MRWILFFLLIISACASNTDSPKLGLEGPENMEIISTDSKEDAGKDVSPDFRIEWCDGALPVVCEAMKEVIEVYQCKDRGESEQLSCTARLTSNASYCLMVPDSRLKAHCQALFYNESDYCEDIEGWARDWCLFDFGKNSNNHDACERIEDPQMQKECFAVINLDLRGCLDEKGKYSYPCVVPIADFTGRRDLCNLLEEKEECLAELHHA